MSRLIIDWRGLKELGWPYSRTQTWRLMKANRFPQCKKLGTDRNSHPVWRYEDIVAHLKAHGLVVTQETSP